MTSIVEMPYVALTQPITIIARNGVQQRVVLRPAPTHLQSMTEWIVNQSLGLVGFELDDLAFIVRWTFSSEQDSALFRLRWG